LTFKARKWFVFPTPPFFEAPARGNPLEFLDETYHAKTRETALSYGKNVIILTSTVFVWFTRVTGMQTDGRVIAYSALSIGYAMLLRAEKILKCIISPWLSIFKTTKVYYSLFSFVLRH